MATVTKAVPKKGKPLKRAKKPQVEPVPVVEVPAPVEPVVPVSPYPMGHTEARIFTPPLVVLTPATSYGFAVVEYARDVLKEPLDPWEEWAAIHAGELLADGRPRFRTLLIIVARQNGKTHLLKVLTLYWLFVQKVALILGTSTNLDYAREAWDMAVEMVESLDELSKKLPPKGGIRRTNGEQTLTITSDKGTRCRYKIAASNRKGGRSLSIDRLVLDELREHHDYSAWNASTKATNARPNAQIIGISNMGDVQSVVLNDFRKAAIVFIQTGVGDYRKGLLEWSAPEGSDVEDVNALAAANPNAGLRIDWDTLIGDATSAKIAGGEQEAGFKTEVMCQYVPVLDPAMDAVAWDTGALGGDLSTVRGKTVLCLDISPDELHATLMAAAVMPNGHVRVDPVEAWDGQDATAKMKAALPALVKKIKPALFGWLPSGPAAALTTFLTQSNLGVKVQEIKADTAATCMGFAESVKSGEVEHGGDPLLDAQVKGAEKAYTGDKWVFSRKGGGHCDAAYAAAGAVHLARTVKVPSGIDKFISVDW